MFYALSQWALLIILAKVGGPDVLGRYTLALAVTSPIVLFCNLQLRSLLASDVRGEVPFEDYARLRLASNLFAFTIVTGVALSFGYTFQQVVTILLVGIAKIIESSSELLFGLMQRNERLDLVCFSQIVRGSCTVAVFGATLFATRSLMAAVMAMVIVWISVLVFVDYRNLTRLPDDRGEYSILPRFWRIQSKSNLVLLARKALPLGIASVLISLNSNVPRYFVESYHGEIALGYLAAIAYFSVGSTTLVEAIGQASLARLANYHRIAPHQYWLLMGKLGAIAVGVGLLGLGIAFGLGKPLLTLVYDARYADYLEVLRFVMVLGAVECICSILGVGLIAARILDLQVPTLTLTLALTIASAWWLVPGSGIKGAVESALLANLAWVSIYLFVTGRHCWQLRKASVLA